eukprot:6218210-Prymnesium_polylepis.1
MWTWRRPSSSWRSSTWPWSRVRSCRPRRGARAAWPSCPMCRGRWRRRQCGGSQGGTTYGSLAFSPQVCRLFAKNRWTPRSPCPPPSPCHAALVSFRIRRRCRTDIGPLSASSVACSLARAASRARSCSTAARRVKPAIGPRTDASAPPWDRQRDSAWTVSLFLYPIMRVVCAYLDRRPCWTVRESVRYRCQSYVYVLDCFCASL